MKTLLVLRHGKSSWQDPFLADPDRPLKKRGKRAAKKMGEEIRRRALLPELVLSSKAKRARQTAKRAAEAMGYEGEVLREKDLYFTSAKKHLDVIAGLDDRHSRVLLVGHNPDLEDLVEKLTGESPALPTAALAAIELAIDAWKDVAPGKGTLSFLVKPKELGKE
ncbi:MAG: histidine phosphatase family protein [Planctomycetes bacterium]|nr:histidine phosphatase family protein [Planctomycetota bacterium]